MIPARSRQRGIATSELGIVSVILLIIGLLMARGCAAKTDEALECLTSTASTTGGQGLKCPVSKAPFLFPVCPDPDRHLRFPPRFERPGRSRQDLPTAAGTPALEVGRMASTLTARQNGPSLVVDVRPRFWWRYIGGPIVQILCVIYVIAFFVQLNPKDRAPNGIIVMTLIAGVLSCWLLWITVPGVEGSQAFEFDASGKRVVHHRYLFGWERAPVVYETEFAPVFVRTRAGWAESYSMVLIRNADGQPEAVQLIDGLSEDHSALGSWLRARLPH